MMCLGIIIDSCFLTLEKAYAPIAVTDSGITVLSHPTINLLDAVSMIALQFSRESYVVFPSSTFIEESLLQ